MNDSPSISKLEGIKTESRSIESVENSLPRINNPLSETISSKLEDKPIGVNSIESKVLAITISGIIYTIFYSSLIVGIIALFTRVTSGEYMDTISAIFSIMILNTLLLPIIALLKKRRHLDPLKRTYGAKYSNTELTRIYLPIAILSPIAAVLCLFFFTVSDRLSRD